MYSSRPPAEREEQQGSWNVTRALPVCHRAAGRVIAPPTRGVAGPDRRFRLLDPGDADHGGRADDAQVDRPAAKSARECHAGDAARLLRRGPRGRPTSGQEPVVAGPRDLRQLPEFFGRRPDLSDYGPYDIEILAEINHAPRLPLAEILARARWLESQGADVIDLGCDPGPAWPGVGEAVRALRSEGRRVSIDSFNPAEIEPAVGSGAELVLSVNRSNLRYAAGWGCEVVVVPDAADALGGLETSIARLAEAGVKFRIDPILSPIAFGMSDSLGRYLDVRRRRPQAEMLMGIGNLTELTEVDSAGINVLLLGFCQEQRIHSVLTTQEINWTRSAVRECDLARRLVHYAVGRHVLPKHLESGLLMLRSARSYWSTVGRRLPSWPRRSATTPTASSPRMAGCT